MEAIAAFLVTLQLMTRLNCQQYEAIRLRSQHILALIKFSTLADICQIGLVQLCCHQVRSHARFIVWIGQIRGESGHIEHRQGSQDSRKIAASSCSVSVASETLYTGRTGPSDGEGSRHLLASPCIGTETQLHSLHYRFGERAQQCARLTLHKTSRGLDSV